MESDRNLTAPVWAGSQGISAVWLEEGAVQPVFLYARRSVFASSHRLFSRRPMIIGAFNIGHA